MHKIGFTVFTMKYGSLEEESPQNFSSAQKPK